MGSPVMLDAKDRQILSELDRNARQSHSRIGRKLRLSPEVVQYRVKKLEERGIIQGYHASVRYWKLGVIHFKLCLRFTGAPIEEEEAYYAQLKPLPNVIWIARCRGEWDAIIACTVNDIVEMDRVKNQILALGGALIIDKEISVLVDFTTGPRDFLVNRKRDPPPTPPDRAPLHFDELDLNLLRKLSHNSRTPAVDLARELGSTPKTIAARIKRLVRDGVIQSFRLIVGYEETGILFHKAFIVLKEPKEERVRALYQTLNLNPHVIQNLTVFGPWDLEPEFEYEDEQEFDAAIQELKRDFSDIIQRIIAVDVLQEYKYTLFYK